MTGTRVPQILHRSQHHSAFEAAAYIIGARHGHYVGDRNVSSGQKLEPKQIDFARDIYGREGIQVQSWEEVQGPGVYDAWPEDPIFGGKWDAVGYDRTGRPLILIECKKTKYPLHIYPDHLMQAVYYGYMTGADWVRIIQTYCPEGADEDAYEVTKENTKVFCVDMRQARPVMERYLAQVKAWYEHYILQGITPPFDPNNKHDIKVLEDLVKWGKLPADVLN